MRPALAVALLAGAACGGGSVPAPPQFVCRGNEPFWNLEIVGDRVWLRQLGEDPVSYTGCDHRSSGGFELECKEDGETRLRASISEERCLDTMSDETPPFTHRAHIVLADGSVVSGCCNAGPRPERLRLGSGSSR